MFARRFTPVDVYFIFSIPLLTFINTKENICEEELLMEDLDFSLSLINKHKLSMEYTSSHQKKNKKQIMSPPSANSQQSGQTTDDNIS